MAKFTISKKTVIKQFNKVKEFCDIVSYSSKTNPQVTPILEEQTDCMFSVHSGNELMHITDKSRVLFLAQAWDKDQIKRLTDMGIRSFVVDNSADLEVLKKYLEKVSPNSDSQNIGTSDDNKINIQLRMKLRENTLRTERYFVFGMDTDYVDSQIKILHADFADKIKGLGIHFHRKTQNMSEWNMVDELEGLFSDESLKIINYLNIGGGLPSEYANTNAKVIKGIFNKITEFKEWLNSFGIKLIIEPGRFIAAPCGKLVSKIIGMYENNIIVDASVYNSDLDAIVVPVKLKVEGELEKEDKDAQPFVIKGVTPCSLDLFRYRVYLKAPKVGDNIVFINAGAYNFHSDFCDLKKIPTEIID